MNTIESGTLQEIWQFIDQKLSDNNEPYSDWSAIFEFHITDKEALYQLEFKNGKAIVHNHVEKDAKCILKMKEKHFRKFLLGELNSNTAFMTGKLKVDGNIGLALKLEGLLKKYQFTE